MMKNIAAVNEMVMVSAGRTFYGALNVVDQTKERCKQLLTSNQGDENTTSHMGWALIVVSVIVLLFAAVVKWAPGFFTKTIGKFDTLG